MWETIIRFVKFFECFYSKTRFSSCSSECRRYQSYKVFLSLLCLGAVVPAYASSITFAVISPYEYDLPLKFKPFNVFVQYGEFQSDGTAFGPSGNSIAGPGTHTIVGLSKYVHFWTFKSLPQLGFAYEVILPEVNVYGNGVSASGIQGPLTGPAIWFKPSSNSTLGFQSFFQIPVGTSEVANRYWSNFSSIFYDVNFDNINIDGDAGTVFHTDQHMNGQPDTQIGQVWHANLRLAYHVSPMFQPFLAVDWQSVGSNHQNGVETPNSYSRELSAGGGLRMAFTPKISLALHYSTGVSGANTPVTQALYAEYIYLW